MATGQDRPNWLNKSERGFLKLQSISEKYLHSLIATGLHSKAVPITDTILVS